MMEKKLFISMVLVLVVAMAQAAVVFTDDFEANTAGTAPAGWSASTPGATVMDDDGSVFSSGNKYVELLDDSDTASRYCRKYGLSPLTGVFVTLSFDMYEPVTTYDRSFVVRLGTSASSSATAVDCRFDDGRVSTSGGTSQGVSNAYTLDSGHYVTIVVNLTGTTGTYHTGISLDNGRYDVWIDNELVISNAEFRTATVDTISIINFSVFTGDTQLFYFDNVELLDEALVIDKRSAQNPTPEYFQENVAIDQTLSWEAGLDIATGGPVEVLEYYLYLSDPTTDPNLSDPNLLNGITPITIPESGGNGGSYTPPSELSLDSTYIWRVDEKLTDGTIVKGPNWVFTTVPPAPVFSDLLPADATVGISENAEFVVEAINPYTGDSTGLSYQWKFSADGVTYSDVTGGDSAILSLSGVQVSNQGYYYCEATLDSNGSKSSSNVAILTVKQTLAHWTMDQADFVGGLYIDIVGGHNADPNTDPNFVAGAGPDMPAAGAAVINPDSHAPVGIWNPAEITGQVTISAWIKWDGGGLGTYGRDILSKQDAYGVDTMMWNLRLLDVDANGNGGVRFYNASGLNINIAGLVPVESWTHVCAVYGSGQAGLYINGTLVGSDNLAGLGNGTASLLAIGGNGNIGFPGAMDNVMIHNYAMSAEEVATLYYQTSQEAVCLYPPVVDLNDDCETNLLDFAIFVQSWIDCGLVPAVDCGQ